MFARVGDRALLLQPLPRDAGDRVHTLAHLVEHVGNVGVVPGQTQAARQLIDDPEILPRVAGRIQRPAPQLHHPVGVGERSVLLRKRGCWKHDVCQITGFRQENILYDQVLQFCQRLPGVMHVGIGHRRILTHDVHATDGAGVRRMHDLDHGQARLGIEFRFPQLLEPGARRITAHGLVVREHHRDQARVGRALHVVLTAQRMQAGTGPTDLTGHHRQRNQAPRVVRAVDMLRDTHAPENDRSLRSRVQARDLLQRFGRNAANRRHLLWAESFDILLQRLIPDGPVGDEGSIDQAFVDDGVHHRVQHRHVGVRIVLQEIRRVTRQIGAARVGHDQLGAVLGRVLDPGRADRVIAGRVGADDEHDLRLDRVHDRVGDRARAQPFQQRRDAGGVAKPRAVVDVVGAESGTHELLEQVSLLVRTLGRAEASERLRAAGIANFAQFAGGKVERFFPAGFAEDGQRVIGVDHEIGRLRHARFADQRLGQALLVVHVIEAVTTLHAQAAVVRRPIAPLHAQDLVVLDVVGQLAADAAIRAQ